MTVLELQFAAYSRAYLTTSLELCSQNRKCELKC